jgi:hypothetical protein
VIQQPTLQILENGIHLINVLKRDTLTLQRVRRAIIKHGFFALNLVIKTVTLTLHDNDDTMDVDLRGEETPRTPQ